MLKKLQSKWGVSALQLLLIIATFAVGGSLCGYAGRKILALTPLDKGLLWVILYVIIVTILWPVAVILVSIPLGQFKFFKNYLHKMFTKISGSSKKQQPQ
ncbi:DUF6787 family protein [Ferruginibacter yonginensis]|uniref:DUF6787 family protein n=1 Tax=Ferruginibacter yonginensis TaxID=1310416 RepID=A0ABV8QT42_9BACT